MTVGRALGGRRPRASSLEAASNPVVQAYSCSRAAAIEDDAAGELHGALNRHATVDVQHSLARSLLLSRDVISNGGPEVMTMTTNDRSPARARLDVAREEQDTAASRRADARGPGAVIRADAELRAAHEEVAAREAWVAWADRDHDGP